MIRVRFAPSPTGTLHIGSARTALFNWLYARHTGGQFLLRIEDTDPERSTEASLESVLEAMEWMGLEYDEEMILQTSRVDEHIALAEKMLAEGKAYRCYAGADELAAMKERAYAEGRTRIYERSWRDRTDHPTGPYTVRIKMPTEGKTTIHDLVLGDVTVAHDDLDDFIILRSDGSPTYNFVVVCDDVFMNVTHVIRGQDHVSNTFRQVQVYRALGAELPTFGHAPLIDGLSKRKGSLSVQHYRDAGFLQEAIINYVARLGWSHGDQEIFSVDELVALFDMAGVNASSGKFDDAKLAWVNSEWMQRLDPATLAPRLVPFLEAIGVDATVDDRLLRLVRLLQPRSKTLVDMAEQARFVFAPPVGYEDGAVKKWMKDGSKAAFEALTRAFETVPTFDAATIEATVEQVLALHDLKMGKLAQPIRVALTGTAVSPGIFESAELVGQVEVVRRMRAAQHLYADAQRQ
jgi:glutamyl-tRNA synthetase